jgi:DNA helicase-4
MGANLANTLIFFAKYKSEFFAFNDYKSQSEIDKFKTDYDDDYKTIKTLLINNQVANTDLRQAKELVYIYENLENLCKEHNEKFIEHTLSLNKKYFDTMLETVDANVMLDDEQRRAIIADEDYCLLVAGAGAGKTTTMAAKVKYLTEIKGIKPQDIVVISFTNKAIDELKERIQVKLGIPANVVTFHKFGYDILKNQSSATPTIEYSAARYVFECLEKQIFENKTLLNKVMLFLGYYLNIPEEALKFENLNAYYRYKTNNDFQTMKSSAGEYIRQVLDRRKEQKRTITGEYVRSEQETQIANFLYLNNVEYEYEKPYPFTIAKICETSNFRYIGDLSHVQIATIKNQNKPYQPDFTITQNGKTFYLEHFGITESYMNNRFTSEELTKYKNSILFKRRIHQFNHTILLETFSGYNDRRSLLEHLKIELERFEIKLTPKSNEEVYRKLVDTSKDKYVYRFGYLILDFIRRYKECGYDKDGFKMIRKKQDNVRTNIFLDIAEEIYNYYQSKLAGKNSIDFADMINNAEIMLREAEHKNIHLPYKYIIIDEFQDIARQRFNLTKTLANLTGAKIVAVGDDWQSIFAFAGSDITLFQRFLDLMGHGVEMQINHTYRNSQELIDIAGGFIQKNPTQIKKRLISPKSIKDPIELIEYDGTTTILQNWAKALDETVENIVKQYGEKSSILFITRYAFEKDRISGSAFFGESNKADMIVWRKNPKVQITCLTAHSSKGLGFDNVVIVNMREAVFGFPSQLDDDPVLKLVTTQDFSIPFAEERRLFYVALTRTKNKVYIVLPFNAPSRFILELIADYKIKHSEKLSFEIKEANRLVCPLCGATLKFQSSNNLGLSLPLYMCTNDPEICDFMTNSKQCLADIFKCSDCADGYMVVRENKKTSDYFYACTSYPKCNNMKPIPDKLKPQKEKNL